MIHRTCTVVFLTSSLAFAGTMSETQQIEASDKGQDDLFGFAMAVEGDTAIVTAPVDSNETGFGGTAYVLKRGLSGMWSETGKILPAPAQSSDRFGLSLGLHNGVLAVGAPLRTFGSSRGLAYVFERNEGGVDNWGQLTTLLGSDSFNGDHFGSAIAVGGATGSEIIVVGADLHTNNNFGAAYVFARDENDPTQWTEVKKLNPPVNLFEARFGDGLAITGAPGEEIIAVAASRASSPVQAGRVYLFGRNVGGAENWGLIRELASSTGVSGGHFGQELAFGGDTGDEYLIVVAPSEAPMGAAHVFGRNTGGADNWGFVKRLVAQNGEIDPGLAGAVAISNDIAIIGSVSSGVPGDRPGAAFVFSRNEGGLNNWGQIETLIPSDGVNGDMFGASVAAGPSELFVGAPFTDEVVRETGSVYIFASPSAGCSGDCDGSGAVDFNDLVSILFEFGPSASGEPCDVDNSGVVDFNDLVASLFLFGPCA